MLIEIVTHCWCPPGWDGYAQMLRWQFASLILNPCDATVQYTVLCADDDKVTQEALSFIINHKHSFTGNIQPFVVSTNKERLFRRAILRNQRAQDTIADVIWFTDVDYLFGPNCLQDVISQVDHTSNLHIPKHITTCKDHETGDQLIEDNRDVELPSAPDSKFTRQAIRRAIGGVQIIGRDILQEVGYLKDTPWVQPISTDNGFRSCRCDKQWRRLEGIEDPIFINIRNLYRLRHTRKGRDYDVKGDLRGTEVWK